MQVVTVLITGGAGFICSTVASACLDAGITPVILDNLTTGCREFVTDRISYEGDIADDDLLDRIFAEQPDIETTVHCAALNVVPESVSQPLRYYRENVAKSVEFIAHLLRNRRHQLILSSSASVYGPGPERDVAEDSPIAPASPCCNPIGADPKMRTGLPPARATNVVSVMVVSAQKNGVPFAITGTDYPTRDGSGVRDYIHVWDLAQAHVAAVERMPHLFEGRERTIVVNLGTARGTTVREPVNAFNTVTDGDRAERLLGWRAAYSVADCIRDSPEWATRDSEAVRVG